MQFDGVLNFVRAHRAGIEHVRVVIACGSEADGGGACENDGDGPVEFSAAAEISSSMEGKSKDGGEATGIASAETERSLMELERHIQEMEENERAGVGSGRASDGLKYLVLFQLRSVEDSQAFVSDLDGRPYTTLQEDVTGSLRPVAALQGEGGVSLMSPFFAPSSMGVDNMNSRPIDRAPSTTTAATTADAAALNVLAGEAPTIRTPPLQSSVEGTSAGRRRARAPIGGVSVAYGGGATACTPSEIQNCAVCLERMEMLPGSTAGVGSDISLPMHGSGIITTVCNHTFHIDCLLKWQDSPCPVCRFDHSGLDEALSQCHLCGTTEHNYVCLICGVISCGGAGAPVAAAANDCAGGQVGSVTRPGSAHGRLEHLAVPPILTGHAQQHYNDTLHAYALDTETQHVWDFAGQGYVHRLIQNKDDGKLVEVNDPSNTNSHERTLDPGLSDAQEGEIQHRKLEGFASQYYTVLKSQLEQQRIFYEAQLEEIRREHDRSYHHGYGGSRERRSYAQDLISALKQERNQLEQRCMGLGKKYQKVTDDVAFLKNMNESLEANKEPLRKKIEEAQLQKSKAKEMTKNLLPPLEAKVAMMIAQLEQGVVTNDS